MGKNNSQWSSRRKNSYVISGKKGASIIMMIFEILVVIFVISLAFSIASRYVDSESVNKVIYAQEMQLMVETFVGIPGDASVEFPKDVSAYSIAMDSTRVIVSLVREGSVGRVERSFHLPPDYEAAGAVKEVKKVCLIKTGVNIILKQCGE